MMVHNSRKFGSLRFIIATFFSVAVGIGCGDGDEPILIIDEQEDGEEEVPSITGLDVMPDEVLLAIGERLQLEVSPQMASGDDVADWDEELIWTSGDQGVVAVDDQGIVLGTGEGATWVQVSAGAVESRVQVEVVHKTWRHAANTNSATCATTWEGDLYCWGQGYFGVFAVLEEERPPQSEPTPVEVGIDVAGVAMGIWHYCAWSDDQPPRCWGYGPYGQVGVPATEVLQAPIEVDERIYSELVAGEHFTCGISQGEVYCWGHNAFGQLGRSGADVVHSPRQVELERPAVSLAAGAWHGCAIDDLGNVICWGWNGTGAVNPYSPSTVPATPTKVDLPLKAHQVAATRQATCALTEEQTVYCWGMGAGGALGRGTVSSNSIYQPAPAQDLSAAIDLVGGFNSFCARTASGSTYCWGDNRYGALGTGSGYIHYRPTEMIGDHRWELLSTFGINTCGVDDEDKLWCWGRNAFGEVGDGRPMMHDEFLKVEGLPVTAESLVTGGSTVCASGDESTYCWGDNHDYKFQKFRPAMASTPEELSQFSPATLGIGTTFACGLDSNEVACWGRHSAGGLGRGQMEDEDTRALWVAAEQNFANLSVAWGNACAIDNDGQVLCWGENGWGQVGDTPSEGQATPRRVDVDEAFVELAVGPTHTCALTDEGRVYCWGSNIGGELGRGDRTEWEPPAPTIYEEEFVEIGVGFYFSCGLTVDGRVLCWGSGANFSGDTEDFYLSTPRQFQFEWDTLRVSDFRVCALRDGELRCAGRGRAGWTGESSRVFVDALTPIAPGLEVIDVAFGERYLCIADSGGDVFCRGVAERGVTGDGEAVIHTEPYQVVLQ